MASNFWKIGTSGEVISEMVDKMSFIGKLSMLSKATADDDQALPGYLYQEINNITFESSGYCLDLVLWLDDRLGHKSPSVKLKVLRIMRYVISNGQVEFRHQLKRRSQRISEATKFSGAPDPLRGHAPYIEVREAAKVLLEALFMITDDSDTTTTQQQNQPIVMSGLGSSSRSGHMEGFGNTAVETKAGFTDTVVTGLRDLAERVVEISGGDGDKSRTFFPAPAENRFGGYKPVKMATGAEEFEGPRVDKAPKQTRKQPKRHQRGVAGGGWDDESGNRRENSEPISDSDTSSGSKSLHVIGSRGNADGESLPVNDWTLERDLVAGFLRGDDSSTGGNGESNQLLSYITQREFINRAFLHLISRILIKCKNVIRIARINRCQKLNSDKVVELLNDQLSNTESSTTSKMNALLCIEALLRSDLVSIASVAEYSHKNLINLYQQKQCNELQQKSRKIIRILERLSPTVQLQYFSDLQPKSSTELNNSTLKALTVT